MELLHQVESIFSIIVQYGVILIECAGVMVLMSTAIKSIKGYINHDPNVRLSLAKGIALALEFKLGGEVLHTVIAREWADLLILGAIIALRGVLTLLLHWEIKIEEDKEQLEILDHQNVMMAAKLASQHKEEEKKDQD